jgi:hypothetical protein
VPEFYQMLEGALWREERWKDLLAWHAAHIMNGSGAKAKSGGSITMEMLLGRPPIPLTKAPPPKPEPEPAVDDKPRPPTEAVDPIRARLEQLAAMGMVTRVQ